MIDTYSLAIQLHNSDKLSGERLIDIDFVHLREEEQLRYLYKAKRQKNWLQMLNFKDVDN